MADPLADLLRLDGVFEAVDAARAAVDGLLREPALRQRRSEVTAESLRRGSWASYQLAGGLSELDSFYPPFTAYADAELAGAALRTNVQLAALIPVWRTAPLQALARLHTLASSDDSNPDSVGRPREDPSVTPRLAQLVDVVTQPTQAPAVIVAAIVHAELLVVEPFSSRNDVVARAAMRLVLMQRGVDPDSLSVPEEGLLEQDRESLKDALEGYRSATPPGLARWLTVSASAVARGAALGRRICHELA